MAKKVVLFVHGLGEQSQLSALLHPLLSLTTHLETGLTGTQRNHLPNLLPDWDVVDLDIHRSPPSIQLTHNPSAGSPDAVKFYEFNYSHLTEVIRDINAVSLERLLAQFHEELAVALPPLDKAGSGEAAIAKHVLRIGDVVLASSAPMLGIFPFFTQYLGLGHVIKAYRRFFADVATCALDYPGADLLFSHFNRTVESIFEKEGELGADDQFIIVAHSLGTVLTHGYLVQRWSEGKSPRLPVPQKILTFGTAVSLLCWLWLYLDYELMNPNKWKARTIGRPGRFEEFMTFCWSKLDLPQGFSPQPLKWINVLNRLDPIATKVPSPYVFFDAPPASIASALPAGVEHRFTYRGWWRGSPHNTYFQDRPFSRKSAPTQYEQFSDILMEVLGFANPRPPEDRIPEQKHWTSTNISLWCFSSAAYLLGLAAMAFAVWSYSAHNLWRENTHWGYLTPLCLFAIPGFVVTVLSLAHKMVWGSWRERVAKPGTYAWRILFWLRKPLFKFQSSQQPRPDTEPFTGERLLRRLLSLITPATLLVLFPWFLTAIAQDKSPGVISLLAYIRGHYFHFLIGILSASFGTLALCASSFFRAWRAIVLLRRR